MITVIIVNWNGCGLICDCLDSLRAQTFSNFSTIVVDNGSMDGSVELIGSRYPEVGVIALGENRGFCTANNIALARVNTPYAALLNNDGVAHPDWLLELVNALEAHPEAGSATSRMVYHDRPEIIDRAGDGYTRAGAGLLRGRGMPAADYDQAGWVFGACGGASIYRKKMLDDIGLLDPDFFLICEDVDLSFRAQLKGYRCLYVPGAMVYHKVSSSVKHDSSTSVYYGHRNVEWVYLKNMPARLLAHTLFLHMCYIAFSFAFFAVRGQGMTFLKAKKDALGQWKRVMRQRRTIQAARAVPDAYIWDLLEKESFLSRLSHRLSISGGKKELL